ncbi:MAG: MBL fold metallo-hydrolase [Candidatus Dormibacteraceae bacterium]
MKLSPDVYLVGGGNLGFNISDPGDCHVYVIDGGDELAVIDSGVGAGVEQILDNIRADGLDVDRIGHLIVTHYHADHAGGLGGLRRLTGARTYASVGCAPAIANGDEEAIALAHAKRGGFYPPDYKFDACPIDHAYDEDDEIRVGDLRLIAINTPGHCAGHSSLLLQGRDRTYLFSGDSLFWGGTVILQNIPDCSLQDTVASVEKLASLEFDALLPGHLTISLKDGKRHAAAAAATVRSLGIPKQAVQI